MAHCLPAVLGLHATGVGVDVAVRAASGLGHSPAGLSAVPRCLAVLLGRPHHPLPGQTVQIVLENNYGRAETKKYFS